MFHRTFILCNSLPIHFFSSLTNYTLIRLIFKIRITITEVDVSQLGLFKAVWKTSLVLISSTKLLLGFVLSSMI